MKKQNWFQHIAIAIAIAPGTSGLAQDSLLSQPGVQAKGDSDRAPVRESCTESDPIFAAELSGARLGLRHTQERAQAVRSVLQEAFGANYTDDHPEVVEALQGVQRQQERLDTLQQTCIDRINVEGEFVPDGLTLQEWRQVKSEIQRYFRRFTVSRTAIRPIPSEGCPNAEELPPCGITVDIVDWDVIVTLHFARESDRWIRVFPVN
jgi:hypothetical protein